MERRKNTLKKITKKKTTKKRITKKRNIKKINTLKKITKKRTTKKRITEKRNIKKRNTKRRLIGGMQGATEAGGSYSALAEYDPLWGEILMKGKLQKYTYSGGWEEREFMVTPNGLYWNSPTKGPRSVDGKYFNSIKKGSFLGWFGKDETDFTLSTSYRDGMDYKFRSNASEIEGWLEAFQSVIDSKKLKQRRAEDVAPELFSQTAPAPASAGGESSGMGARAAARRVEVDEGEDVARPEAEKISELAQILMKGKLQKYTYSGGWEEREFMVTPNGLYWESPIKGSRSVDGKYFNSIKKGSFLGPLGNDETDFTLSTSYRGGKDYKFRSKASEIKGWLGAFQIVIDNKRGVVPEVRAEDVTTEAQADVSGASQPSGKPGVQPWPQSVRASELTREELRAAGYDSIPEGEEHLWTVLRPRPKSTQPIKLDWDPMGEDWGSDLFSDGGTTGDQEEMELSEKMWSEGLTPHRTKTYLTDHLKKKSTGLWGGWDEIFLKLTGQGIYWVEGGVLNSIPINNIEHCRLVDGDKTLEIKTYKTQEKEEMPTYEFKLSETRSSSSLVRWLELLNFVIEMKKRSEKMDTLHEDLLMGDAQKMAVAEGRLRGADGLAEKAAATEMLNAARDKARIDMDLSKKDLNQMVATKEAERKRERSPAVPIDERRQFAPGSNEDLQMIMAEMARREQLQEEEGGGD